MTIVTPEEKDLICEAIDETLRVHMPWIFGPDGEILVRGHKIWEIVFQRTLKEIDKDDLPNL